SLRAELGGGGVVHQRARVRGAHLHQDALVELAQRLPIQAALQVDERITPEQGENTHRRAFLEHLSELAERRLVVAFAREAEIIIGAAQVAQALHTVYEQELR